MFGFSRSPQEQSLTVSSIFHSAVQTISNPIHANQNNPHNPKHFLQKKSFFEINKPILYLLVAFIFTFCFHPTVLADTLISPSFQIDMSTINMTGGNKSSASYRLSDTVGQTVQGQFNSAGYIIKAGFQYIQGLTPFTFTISNLDLNYGSLIPGTPSLLTNILTVTTGSAYGYTVKTLEDHPLRISNGVATIADTSCDLASTCTQSDATPWTVGTRYGFGYNIQGTDVDTADFVDSTYFRPFPIQDADQPATVMSRVGIATASAATVTYKVNISGTQAAGTYQNNIQYIAIPSF
ncbi:MAG: hypothetical protein UW64_C0009G0030 [Microgenomates group bacterium GW2011_GWC1_44_37]|uniref:Uncharacterized protein n=1 Tax=Candidatus Collierbacteria bacterium GW2011_GWB2_44_22 TaxID=1618387 RepID=A0A0G1HY71_9BACT|nr:MAG: hypothetical protein UW31_C0002G0032 [Candidatus Collierbacteria bacterium GW2011_GWA2_44_13]KKT51890.1 MAG: hypothetical protein UW44_C0006G0008 [Candidatus Collierbacteria bacterium GW2011_GWB2_44_22]KKT62200.1 MAG: hypothetical protein UW56_C0010G0032 [Candidatus Collierbacteria bacterium GW2011_GWD1_44_27]KKT66187.1 MAG: hypothetical protein UW58_C0012G0029 [Candidatus Collierbacteria bacterium GW2011_GWC2_44_30]KKT68818.1 MAG: hypothetical protein UW64_C0009G0030 [Microgenomates gr